MKTLLQFRKLSKDLKTAYGQSDVHQRVKDVDGWLARVPSEGNGGAEGYDHASTVQEYYDLCTNFMVFGWSESLHFAPLSPQESLEESQIRHQRLMISKLELREGMNVIDVGCGVGGPLRRVVREAGVSAVGINMSEVQLGKARAFDAEAGIDGQVEYLATNFMNMDVIEDETFDRGWAIESTCHAPDKAGAFAEIYRVLKPGALFWGQEMCLTEKFDPDDKHHQDTKEALMLGIALKEIATFGEVNQALESAGFEVIEGVNRAEKGSGPFTPWYQPMESRHGTLGGAIYRIPLGRKLLIWSAKVAELLRVFPKGSAEVIEFMDRTANAYVEGGRTGIFTPLYCFLARKPL